MNPNEQNPLGDPQKPLDPSQNTSTSPEFPPLPPQSSTAEPHADASSIPPRKEGPEEYSSNKREEYNEKKKETLFGLDEKYDFAGYAKQNKEAVTTYALLLIGILFLVFDAFLLGSLIIGLIAGYHFSHEIVFYLRNLTQIFAGQEQVRYIVLTAVVVALFIAIPGIFIGALVAAVLKQVILGNREM